MAENLNTLEINETLKQLLSEVKGQKQELNSLKEEVRGTSVSVSSEVQKLKKEKELKWRFEGHKIQFVFNTELEDGFKQALWAYNNKKGDYLVEFLNELLDKIKERNKFIRIADSSEGGWETVRQYESNPLASDSEDESRIRRAEAQAIRKKKTKRPSRYNKARPFFPNTTSSFGAAAPAGASSFLSSGRNPVLPTFQVRQDHSFRPYPSTSTQGPFTGACFACGDFTHFRRNCPFVGAEQHNSTAVKKWLWSDSPRWQERSNI